MEEWVRRFGRALPMRMTASWFGSLDLPHTRLWRDSTAPESGLPSDCHPDCIIVLEAVRMSPGEIEPRTRRWKNASPCLTQKAPYKGLGAESEQKRERQIFPRVLACGVLLKPWRDGVVSSSPEATAWRSC